jgi:plastocyanin
MKSMSSILTLAAVCALATSGAAQDAEKSKDVAELEREVRALEARVRTLSAAAAEMAELMARSAEIWSRAVAGQTPRVDDSAKAAARPKASAAKLPPAQRPAEPVAAVLGTVRGKVTVPAGEPIAYAYVENVFAPPVRGKSVIMDQKNKNFVPSWAVIRRGTTIEFPNHDNIYHNVFSHAAGNSFDLGLYNASSPAKTHSFQAAGSVDIYCNIHPSMAASVLVVPNELFAKVQQDGTFVIENVPSGQRKIVAWSPGTAPSTRWVDLKGGATATVDLVLEHKSRVHQNKEGRAYGSYP